MQPFATILTHWIDGTGAFADLKARVGRLGDDVAAYALHTLGWVRVVQISRYSEFSFDSRSIRVAALEAAIELIGRQARFEGHQLVRVEVFDGRNWLHHTSSNVDELVAFTRHFGNQAAATESPTPVLNQVPYSIDRVWTMGDPQVRSLAEAWRQSGGRLTAALETAMSRDCPDRCIKIMVPSGPTFRFDRYRNSRTGPWDRDVWNRFQGETIQEAVPDPNLAKSVAQSGEFVLRSRLPRLERCRGPVLASEGVRDFAWYRLSLPVWQPGDDRDSTPYGVLTVVSPDWCEEEAA